MPRTRQAIPRIVKELEKAKKRLGAKLKQRADRERKDNPISFKELGIDQIFVDEADAYKNLFYTTKMNRIAGLPNSDSNHAFDMFMKTNYIRELTGGRGVVFATGTPISNTMAEMYTMLRYLGPDLLQERDVEHFDAWPRILPKPSPGSNWRPTVPATACTRVREIHQPARASVDVPHPLRRADRRHAQSAAPEHYKRQRKL
jgi:hypothetical protein